MTVDPQQLARRRQEIENFIHSSPWAAEVPDVPDAPVSEWGTLAWARFAAALVGCLPPDEPGGGRAAESREPEVKSG